MTFTNFVINNRSREHTNAVQFQLYSNLSANSDRRIKMDTRLCLLFFPIFIIPAQFPLERHSVLSAIMASAGGDRKP